MASLKATYSSESEIPEGLADYFKKMADGSFKLQLDGELKTQEDVDRAMKAMEKQKEKRIELQKKLSEYPDDFDADKWEKVKDIDPDQDFSGELGEDAEKEIQKRVTKQVREKERELKDEYKSKLEEKDSEIEERKKNLARQHKESWIKSKLAEEFGFNDQKRLRWMMLDIKAGEYPELKNKIDQIEAAYEDGEYQIKGGSLKDKQGAFDILENISQMDVTKDYKPAADNSGGGANNNGSASKSDVNNLKKTDGSLNITVASQMYREDKEKARQAVSSAGFNPNEIFQED